MSSHREEAFFSLLTVLNNCLNNEGDPSSFAASWLTLLEATKNLVISRAPDTCSPKIIFYHWYMGWLPTQTRRLMWLAKQMNTGKDLDDQNRIFWAAFPSILNEARRAYLLEQGGRRRLIADNQGGVCKRKIVFPELLRGSARQIDMLLHRYEESDEDDWVRSLQNTKALGASKMSVCTYIGDEEAYETVRNLIERAHAETRVTAKLRYIGLFDTQLTDEDKDYLCVCQTKYVDRPEDTFWNGEKYLPWKSLDDFLRAASTEHVGILPWRLVGYLLATAENTLTKRLDRLRKSFLPTNGTNQGETGV